MKYKTIQLSKAADIIVGFPFASEKFNLNAQGIRLVRGKNITTGNLRWGDDTRWWDDFSIDLSKYMLKADDIVIGMDGSLVGKNYAKISENDLPLLLVQRVACIRAKEGYDQRFLWGCIASGTFERYIDSIKTGTSIPHISGGQIGNYLIPDFDLQTQKKVAAILSALDEKIAINRAINDNLEQQAAALYAEMFLNSSNNDVTSGTLSDIAVITMGQSPSGSSYNEDGVGEVFYQGRAEFGFRFPKRRLFTTEPKRMAETGDVLLSVRAPVGDLNVAYESCCIGRGLGAIHSKTGHSSFVLYTMFALKSQLDVFNGEGTVFGSINRDALNAIPIDVPLVTKIDRFEAVAHPIDELIRTNYEENCRLEAIRDSLLPKLMSGEIDVSAVQL